MYSKRLIVNIGLNQIMASSVAHNVTYNCTEVKEMCTNFWNFWPGRLLCHLCIAWLINLGRHILTLGLTRRTGEPTWILCRRGFDTQANSARPKIPTWPDRPSLVCQQGIVGYSVFTDTPLSDPDRWPNPQCRFRRPKPDCFLDVWTVFFPGITVKSYTVNSTAAT